MLKNTKRILFFILKTIKYIFLNIETGIRESRKEIWERYKLKLSQIYSFKDTKTVQESLNKIEKDIIEIKENKKVKEFFSLPKWIEVMKRKVLKIIKSFQRNEDQKYRIKKIIEDGVDIDILYRLQLLASVILATFGLLTNSNPVIIGAMLIAPLLQPIQALSFAISTGRLSLYRKSLKYLGLSILFAIIGAFVLTSLVPFGGLTNEIIARTTPTILDLGVAFASGLIAFLVLGYKKLSGTIVGAAIAASLLPPLAGTGIGLKFMNMSVAWGTFLLFLANLVAIIFAGMLMFWLYKFKATRKDGKNRQLYQIIIMVITAIIISVPLRMSMKQITKDIYVKNNIESSLKTTLPTINPHIQLVSFTKKEETDKTDISLVLKVPDGKNITIEDKAKISKHLATVLQKTIDVQIEVIPITSVYIPKEKKIPLEEKVHIFLADYVQKQYEKTYIVNYITKNIGKKILITLEIYNETPIVKKNFLKTIEEKLKTEFQKDFIVRLNGQVKEKEVKIKNKINELEQELRSQFIYLFPNSEIKSFLVDESKIKNKEGTKITSYFITTQEYKKIKLILKKRKSLLEKKTGKFVNFDISVSYKEKIDLEK